MTNASPLADQDGPGTGSRSRNMLPSEFATAIANAVKNLLRAGLETAERSFLEPVRNGPDHQDSAEARRRTGTKERRPLLPQRWHIEIGKLRNFFCQLF